MNVNFDCGTVFNQFSAEGKFAGASKKILTGKDSPYKITKASVDFSIAAAEVLFIIPEKFAVFFQFFKSIKTTFFECWGISRRITKISNCSGKLTENQNKLNKWGSKSVQFLAIASFDEGKLSELREKYTNKIDQFEEFDEIKQARWADYLNDINSALNGSDESNQSLVEKLKKNSNRKSSLYQKDVENYKFQIKKNYIGIAISIGAIAIEVISLFALAYTSIGGIITFAAIKVTSNLAISCLKYFKFLWISRVKNEEPHATVIKSINHIGVAVLKTKLLPTPDFIHPSLIQGGCQSALSTISIFQRREEYFAYIDDQRDCNEHIAKLEKKKRLLLSKCDLISSGNYQALHVEKQKLENKLTEAQLNIGFFNRALELTQDAAVRDDYQTQIRMLAHRIKKYNSTLTIVQKALDSNHLSDAKKVSETIVKGTEQKISNWKSSKKIAEINNNNDIMKTVLSIVDIARFAFLVFSVYLRAIGTSLNLIPALFISCIVSNAAYLYYYAYNRKTAGEVNQIYENQYAS